MAQQMTATDAAKKLVAGEQLGTVLGMTEAKIQSLAALAFSVYQQGQFQSAAKLFAGVAALDNKNYLGYAGLGAVALAQKPPDLDSAHANLSRAAELNPNDAAVQANLGEVLLRQGKVDEAKQHLETAFKLDPGHNDAGVNRARAIVSGLNTIVTEIENREKRQIPKAS